LLSGHAQIDPLDQIWMIKPFIAEAFLIIVIVKSSLWAD